MRLSFLSVYFFSFQFSESFVRENGIFGSWRKTSPSVISESVLMWFQMIYQMVVSCGAETEGKNKTQAVWIAGALSLHRDRGMDRLATLS